MNRRGFGDDGPGAGSRGRGLGGGLGGFGGGRDGGSGGGLGGLGGLLGGGGSRGGGLGGGLGGLLGGGGGGGGGDGRGGGRGTGQDGRGGGGLGALLGGGGLGGGGGGGGATGGPQKIIGFAVKGIASGIGLVSESRHASKKEKTEKRRESASQGREGESSSSNGRFDQRAVDGNYNDERYHDGPPPRADEEGEALEIEWALDDAQDDIPPSYSVLLPSNRNPDPQSSDQIVDSFLSNNMALPRSAQNASLGRLEYPVLLPQRRPKDRTRGFVRAYAPALESCGIDQKQWLEFLDTFEKCSQTHSIIHVLNLASLATMCIPSVTGIAVGIAVQVAIKVASEGITRYQTNTFLDRINKNYFQPRGLYCLLMTWNPESDDVSQTFDMATSVANSMDSRNKFKGSSAKTMGEGMFPEVAPLIFPGLDHLQNQTGEDAVRHQNKLKKKKAFVDDYFDRRSTAKYGAKHPDSVLATSVPTPTFTSRYADPNHPASSGDLVALITGGRFDSNIGLGGARRGGGGGLGANSQGGQSGLGGGRGGGLGGALGGLGGMRGGGGLNIKKYLKKNVLYLLVVNMPSEQEMQNARREMNESRNRRDR